MFNIFRSRDLNLNLGMSTKNGKSKAYFEKSISTVSSLDKNYLNKIGRKNKLTRTIEMITLKKLRKKYNIKNLHFLKIDCEGMDSSIVLKSSLKDLDYSYLCIELLPQDFYGWKNYKQPKKIANSFFKNYFLKSNVFKKLKKNFNFCSNNNYAFLLKKK